MHSINSILILVWIILRNIRMTILINYPSVGCPVMSSPLAVPGVSGQGWTSVVVVWWLSECDITTISVLPRGPAWQLPAIVFNNQHSEKKIVDSFYKWGVISTTEENNNNKRMSGQPAFLTHHDNLQLWIGNINFNWWVFCTKSENISGEVS